MNHPEVDIAAIRQRLLALQAELREESASSEDSRECIEYGEWIGAKRLEWDPVVLKCIECAA
ncbi:hypothetical protein HVA01_09850 [Halovibrio variabilis]|uniref:DksA C4-type domain-containing protein n=1 Tax=Halovibrio variabilis TaxID=31910 RepID=A0A511UL78_9GAMM|nr:hypothetical protein [Halovibrio variabilis]GEN27339.1 hypothetical protein HVA01_09850 [Halovibrio variabilis]